MDEIKSLSYFSSINHICKKVAIQEKSLIKYLGNKWTEYTPQQQEQLLDDLCVPHSFRKEQPPVADDDEGSKVLSCWPTLKLPSGEKIIVDETDVSIPLLFHLLVNNNLRFYYVLIYSL